MNLPNRLSLLRAALVPVLVACLYLKGPLGSVLGLIVFSCASFTDYLDGYIARKHDMVTTLGKFIDPVADKLLVLSALIMLVTRGMLPAWVVVVVLFREFAIDSLRLVAATGGIVIAASPYGKIKTVTQMFTIAILLGSSFLPIPDVACQVMIVLMVIATLWSGFDYFQKNGALLLHKEEGTKP